MLGELAGTIAIAVYAFDAGGAALVGVYGLARTLPAAVIAPLAMGLSDRLPKERVLSIATGLRAILLAASAVAAWVSGPTVVVVALAAASSALAGTYRPLLVAILPWLARTPGELTAVNVVATTMENAGSLAGPVIAAGLLSGGHTEAAIGIAAGFLGVGATLTLGVRIPGLPPAPHPLRVGLVHDTWLGLKDMAGVAPPAGMAVLLFAQTFVRGAVSVLIVVLAVDVTGAGDSGVGLLYAAIGVGGLIGGSAAAALVRVNRLGRSFVTGMVLWGLPLSMLAADPRLPTCLVAFAVVGFGNAVQDVAGATLTPRLFSPDVIGRVLGAEELIVFAGGGVGSAAGAPMIEAWGPRGALVVLGSGLIALVACYCVRFVQIDRALPIAGVPVELVRGLPMFAPLPLAVVELLAMRMAPASFADGQPLTREGEGGDQYFVIVEGGAAVTVRGVAQRELGPGDGFGEIALLRDIPRTATVTAEGSLQTLILRRDDFLAAVTGNPTSAAIADSVASDRLSDDPPHA